MPPNFAWGNSTGARFQGQSESHEQFRQYDASPVRLKLIVIYIFVNRCLYVLYMCFICVFEINI